MSTAANKTANTSLIAWTNNASGAQVFSSSVDVRTKFGASFPILFGRNNGTILTVGSKLRIEASVANAAPWIPIYTFQSAIGVATIGNTTLNGSLSAAATTALLTSGTNFVAGDLVFIGDSSTANYELARVKSVSTNTLTFEEGIVNSHTNAAVVTNQAEMVNPSLDLSPYAYVRAVLDGVGVGQTCNAFASITTFDSVG